MKLLSIKLFLAYTATTTTAIAKDDNKTNNNLLLRGSSSSSSSPLLISNQWDDGCTPDGSLQPFLRNGLTMDQICERNYGHTNNYPPKHFLVPYKCESGAGYACCVDDLGDSTDQSSVGLGMCTKASSEDDNDNTRSSSSGECKPDKSLNPISRMGWGVSATKVCLRRATIDGTELTVPYTCTSGDEFACCSTDTSNTTDQSSIGLGECTKMPLRDNGLPPLDEEEKEAYDEEEERNPLGCMCLNTRMTPQRGQCCGKCDEGMCPESDVRCQGCDAAESGDTEEGACLVDPSLSPFSRKYSMRSPSQVCEEESSATGSNFTVPYKCRGQQRGGLQYACCEAGLGDEMTSLGGKKCTKEEDDSDNNTRSSSSGGQCTPDGSLNPRSRAQRGISATSICQRKDGFPVPYSCSGHGGPMQGGYACCTSDSDDEVTDPGHGLGKCTKLPKMSNGLPPQNDEEEVLNFVHIGSNSCEEDTSLDGLDSHSKQVNKICQQNHAEDGYTVPYTCNGTAGETTLFACCMPGVGMNVIWESDSSGLGLCTKVEEKEEKEVLVAYE